jgi:uncharacterized protein YndB with AHSA1/START domain
MSAMAAKQTLYIDAPVETVFPYFKDPRKLSDIAGPMDTEYLEIKTTRQGTGTFTSWRVRFVGIPFEGFDVYTDVVPNEHITEKSSNAMVGTWDYTFAPEGRGTRLTLEHHPRSFWGLPPLSYLMDIASARLSASYLPKVKARIEADSTARAA